MFGFEYLKNVSTLSLDDSKCSGCRACLDVCPHAVFDIANKRARIVKRDACMECGACSRNCAWDAISVRAGVGCANALIGAALKRQTAGACQCGPSKDDSQGCC